MLEQQLAQFLSEADNAPATAAPPKAIIGPHAGYIYSGASRRGPMRGWRRARGQDQPRRADRAVALLGVPGLAVDTAEAWAMPGGTVALDTEAIAVLRRLPMVGELDAAHEREHALEVHVPFLQHVLGDFRLVPIVAGDAPPEAVAAVFEALWGGPETLIVVSTDLSHYLDYAACQQIDARSLPRAIERFDPDAIGTDRRLRLACRRAGCCWRRGGRGMAIERLDLRNSGDTAGPRDRVVGYGAWALYAAGARTTMNSARDAHGDRGPTLIELVRAGIAFGLDTGQPGQHDDRRAALPPLLAAPGRRSSRCDGTGMLRGCIGSVDCDASAGRRRGAARVQCGIPRLAVPAAELAGDWPGWSCRFRC